MPYGYLGVKPNQKVKNAGILDVTDEAILNKEGSWGGSLELIESQTVSSVSSIIFDEIQEAKYDVHFLQITNFQQDGADNYGMRWLLSNDGGSSYETSNYAMAYFEIAPDGTSSSNNDTSRAHFQNTITTADKDTSANSVGGGYYYIYNLGHSDKYSFQTGQSMSGLGSSVGASFGGAIYEVAETINAFKFDDWGTGYNIWGTFNLYGVKQL
tara:strand:- start:923 stop:1558 length:636 start_codon:yes stop_codon:yes gene_type:complete